MDNYIAWLSQPATQQPVGDPGSTTPPAAAPVTPPVVPAPQPIVQPEPPVPLAQPVTPVQQPVTPEPPVNNQAIEPPVTPEPVTEPVKPVEAVIPDDANEEPNIEDNNLDLDKQINDLLNDLDTLGKWKEENVNTIKTEEQIKQDEIKEKLDKNTLSVDEKEQITNYVGELETKVAQNELSNRSLEVQKQQLEQMLEAERAKTNQLFEKAKDLEWEQKKLTSSKPPTELSSLMDYYKLMQDNPSMYNQRNFIGELTKLGEQTTELNLDNYVLDWLKRGNSFNTEEKAEAVVSTLDDKSTWWGDLVKAIAF